MKHTIINRCSRILVLHVEGATAELYPMQSFEIEIANPSFTLLIEPKNWAAAATIHGIKEIRAGKTFSLTGVRDFESSLALYLEVETKGCCTIKIKNKVLRRLRGLSHFQCTFDCFVAEIEGSNTIQFQGNYLTNQDSVKKFFRVFRPVFIRNIVESTISFSAFLFFLFLGIFLAPVYYYISGVFFILLAGTLNNVIKCISFKKNLSNTGYIDLDTLQKH